MSRFQHQISSTKQRINQYRQDFPDTLNKEKFTHYAVKYHGELLAEIKAMSQDLESENDAPSLLNKLKEFEEKSKRLIRQVAFDMKTKSS